MANANQGPWWVIGVQIHAAMEPDQVEAFLNDHAEQATNACLDYLRTVPADAQVDLTALIERLGEQILAHTRFLCGQADLSATQAERLMASSREGYDRFVDAFRDEVQAGRGRPGAELLAGVESALAAGAGCEVSQSPELRPLATLSR